MIARRPSRKSWTALALGLASVFVAGPVRAQHQSADPYDPYGAPYRAFAFPVYRWTPDMYGRQAAPGGRAAALVEDYFGDGDLGFGAATGRASGAGVPYYRAYRQLDEDFGRVSRPNGGLDDEFGRSMRARDRAYAEALRETNPIARARKLRAVDRMDLRASRGEFSAPREATTPKSSHRPTTRPEESAAPEVRRSAGSSPPPIPESRSLRRQGRSSVLSPPILDREGLGRSPTLDRLSPRGILSERMRPRRGTARAGDTASPDPSLPDLLSPGRSRPSGGSRDAPRP